MVDALELPEQLGPRFDSELVLSYNWWGRGDSVVRLVRSFTHTVHNSHYIPTHTCHVRLQNNDLGRTRTPSLTVRNRTP